MPTAKSTLFRPTPRRLTAAILTTLALAANAQELPIPEPGIPVKQGHCGDRNQWLRHDDHAVNARGCHHWNTFSIGAGGTVKFDQLAGASRYALDRVTEARDRFTAP